MAAAKRDGPVKGGRRTSGGRGASEAEYGVGEAHRFQATNARGDGATLAETEAMVAPAEAARTVRGRS